MKVHFADCLVDFDARRALRGARELHLTPKAFTLLSVLIENRTRAVSKSELLERVWPEVFVSDASVARAIPEIREAFDDHGRSGRIIRTVHGYGYEFVAEVEQEGPRQTASDVSNHPKWWRLGPTSSKTGGF